MKLFKRIASELPQYRRMAENLREGRTPTLLVGASEIHKAHLIYAAACELGRTLLVITQEESMARSLTEDINAMEGSGEEIAFLYPSREFALRASGVASREYEQIRLGVLARIQSGECRIVCASIEAVLQHTIPPFALASRTFTIDQKGSYSTEVLARRLVKSGYESREQVEGTAQFSIRGGIVDIFPPNHNSPVRLELWGDQIDTMAYFDIQSQRRTERLDKITITPANEVLFDSGEELCARLEELVKKTRQEEPKKLYQADLNRARDGLPLNALDRYYTLAYDTPASLFDYLDGGMVFVSEYANIRERAKTYLWQQQEDQKQILEDGEITRPLMDFDDTLPFVIHRACQMPSVFLDTFARANQDLTFTELLTINPIQTSFFSGELKLLREDVTPLLEQGYAVTVLAGTQKAAASLAHDLKGMGLPAEYVKDTDSIAYRKIAVIANTLSAGLEYPDLKVSLITTGRPAERARRRERFKKGRQLQSLTDLSKGDLVVHVSHGIGVFEGVQQLNMQGVVKDYMKISYAGSDALYVPVTQMDLVSRYIGAKEDGTVRLNSLHSGEWQKTRARAKKAVEDIAEELIKLYAKRMQAPGFPFSPDTEWQKDFEQRFPYVETDDQLKCIEEIKADMERGHPMDRVLCGDVGFGKTEVAMRACFKCIMDGKQCAVLCPTTILAWQHYQSFLKRFDGFPVKIEVLSRFRTPREQKAILEKLREGRVDILIGTHRLVQKDVEFKDLGLAIVDEEQRFGVKHKERFKDCYPNVDMLTLSATPIPRTLNMAISGIRDMSTIEEPPQDRHPVQSYVIEFDLGIIGDAIRKELRRGGQVYYIHNRIETIDLCASRIHSVVPDARLAIAHGQMEERELSEIWRQLLEHEVDILICTTIIETGVDVANCNTLIIENADHMGLSQLYQLRGRVGRSSRRAYAYFTFTRGKVLTEVAQKRLSAIREFTKFGSGFRIAMRDLEIRGAGSLLGAQQHGHMEAVGYDMYLRLLSDAIAEKKGEKPQAQTYECLIDLRLDAHIPESYIGATAQRIDVYKKIAAVRTQEDSMEVVDELIDRFGDPPEAVLSLVDVALLRNTLASYGFEEISEKPQGLLLYPNVLNMEVAGRLMTAPALKGRVAINATTSRPHLILKPRSGRKLDPVETLRTAAEALSAPRA